jgi:hypothetical protein
MKKLARWLIGLFLIGWAVVLPKTDLGHPWLNISYSL